MTQKYSLVIQPNEPVLSRVKEMKQQLRRIIGHYGSANAAAHISLFEFKIEENKYSAFSSYFKKAIAGLEPFEISFTGFGHFEHSTEFTFYVKLEECSMQIIMNYCKQIKKASPYSLISKYNLPHMSVGRKLTKEGLDIAYDLFKELNSTDFCQAFVIRKFNDQRRQYDIEEVIPLLNDKHGNNTQLSLF